MEFMLSVTINMASVDRIQIHTSGLHIHGKVGLKLHLRQGV